MIRANVTKFGQNSIAPKFFGQIRLYQSLLTNKFLRTYTQLKINPFSHGELIIFLKNLFNICTNITAKTYN